MEIINWDLLKNPLNWFVVWTMIAAWAMLFYLLNRHFNERTNKS